MTIEMQGFLQGVAFCMVLVLLTRVIEHRLRATRHRKAMAVIRGIGLEAHHYTPSVEVDDDELMAAFDELARSGYIVASPAGHVVGVMGAAGGQAAKRLAIISAPG
jgi:hypothetical protein